MKVRMIAILLFVLIAVFFLIPDLSEAQRRGWYGRGRGPMASETLSVPKDEQEKKILGVLEDMAQNQVGMLNVPMDDGRLLRLLAETMGAKNVVEIGTSNGYSSIWLLMALRTTGGKLTTFEIDPEKVSLAKSNFKKAGVDHLVTIIEGDAHKEVLKLKGPIDLIFIDADKDGYLDYFKKLLPLVRPGRLIVSHNWNAMDQDYIDALTKNPDLETLIQNIQHGGIGVTLKKR
ncbi:MAG: O-methyltransferase [Desulfobacteraceae bacterium]|jgi:predicted O-methyltransferase YrrM